MKVIGKICKTYGKIRLKTKKLTFGSLTFAPKVEKCGLFMVKLLRLNWLTSRQCNGVQGINLRIKTSLIIGVHATAVSDS